MNDENFYIILKTIFVMGELIFGLLSIIDSDVYLLVISATCLILSFICTVIIKLERISQST